MKPKFVQVDVNEQVNTRNWTGPDYRQAEYVLKYRPDIIILESANNSGKPDTIYNKYPCNKKPIKLVRQHQKRLKKWAKLYEDALSNVRLWDNIVKLWSQNHDVLIYHADSSIELRREFFEVWKYMYPCALKNWLWWVRIYLREKYMAKYVKMILDKHKDRKKLVVAIFIQKFHWDHVKFLLNNPNKKEIWKYYFGNFSEVTPSNIGAKIKKENIHFYKYWKIISDFK